MKNAVRKLLTVTMMLLLLPLQLLAGQPVTAAEAEPSRVLRADNKMITEGNYPNLYEHIGTLQALDEGTIIVKFRYTGNSIMSLFSLSNNTLPDGHFHLYISPTQIGSENRYSEPGKPKANIHIKSDLLTLTPNDMHTVAMVMDKAAGYKLFLDGALIKTDTASTRKFLNQIYAPNSSKLGITERSVGSFQYPLSGEIAYAEVYSKPLADQTLLNITKPSLEDRELMQIKKSILTTLSPSTFVFTGDSVAFAAGQAGGYRNYMQHFEERIRWELGGNPIRRHNFVFNTGMNKLTAAGLLADYDRLVASLNPKTVFIMLGTEDALEHTAMDTFKANLKSIVAKVRESGAVPVLQTGIYPTDQGLVDLAAPYAATVKAVALEDGVVMVDHFNTWKTYSDLQSLSTPGSLLPNELGHLRLAKELMTRFGVGGSGATWSINGFSDVKEPKQRHVDQDTAFTEAGGILKVDLAATLAGTSKVDTAVITLKSDTGQQIRETGNVSGVIDMGHIDANSPYIVDVKAKLAGEDTYVSVNPAYLHSDSPTRREVPAELKTLLSSDEPMTWLFNGDSITHGALHTKGYKSFAELFGERIRGDMAAEYPARGRDLVLNTGVSSMTTRDLMNNFDRWIAANHPDVVFLAFGMNDSSNRLVPIDEFEANLRTAVDQVRELGAIPILETINTIKPADAGRFNNLPAYVDVIRKVAEDKQELLVDHYKYWTDAEKEESHVKQIWLNDNIHPNYIGSTHMAAAIFQALGMDDPNSDIANLRYKSAPAIGALNVTPEITTDASSASIDVQEVMTAAGGAGAVERVIASIAMGNNEMISVESHNLSGTIRLYGLTPSTRYTVKVSVKLKGQNKLLGLNDAQIVTEQAPQILSGISFGSSSYALKVNDKTPVQVDAAYSDNTHRVVTDEAGITVENLAVATVQSGVLIGLAEGETVVTATYGGKQATAVVKVSKAAAEQPATVLTGPTGAVSPGQSFAITYGVRGAKEVFAQDITVEYDTNVMEYTAGSAKSVKGGVVIVGDPDLRNPGKLRLILASSGAQYPIFGDTSVIELGFNANVTQQASGAVQVTNAVWSNAKGEEAAAAHTSISVQVGTSIPGLAGDANGDGKISIGDLAMIAAIYGSNTNSSNWNQIKHLDLNGSGSIDLGDFAAVAMKLVE